MQSSPSKQNSNPNTKTVIVEIKERKNLPILCWEVTTSEKKWDGEERK